jgi:uncharacterized protein YggU (UPF0235/DUF167 family)
VVKAQIALQELSNDIMTTDALLQRSRRALESTQQSQAEVMKNVKAAAQSKSAELESRRDALKQERGEHDTTLDMWQRRIDVELKEIAEREKANAELDEKLASYVPTHGESETRVQALRGELNTVLEARDAMHEAYDASNKRLADLMEQRTTYKLDSTRMRQTLEELQQLRLKAKLKLSIQEADRLRLIDSLTSHDTQTDYGMHTKVDMGTDPRNERQRARDLLMVRNAGRPNLSRKGSIASSGPPGTRRRQRSALEASTTTSSVSHTPTASTADLSKLTDGSISSGAMTPIGGNMERKGGYSFVLDSVMLFSVSVSQFFIDCIMA